MCGMSAVFAALFGTPLTATFFAMEVISVGVIYYVGLVPCIASSLIAYKISPLLVGLAPTKFNITGILLSLEVQTQIAALAASGGDIHTPFRSLQWSFHIQDFRCRPAQHLSQDSRR